MPMNLVDSCLSDLDLPVPIAAIVVKPAMFSHRTPMTTAERNQALALAPSGKMSPKVAKLVGVVK